MQVITQFDSIEYFSTQRLSAKRLSADDLDKFFLMHEDPLVMKTMGGIRTRDETIRNLAWNLDEWKQYGFGIWMFYLKNTNTWIGRGGIRHIFINGHDEVEVGYSLMPEFWHQGYATEIARASIEIAFDILRLKDLIAFTLPTNKMSQRVINKVGFQYQGEIIHADSPHLLYRMQSYRVAEIVSYDKTWPEKYLEEADKIKSTLGDLVTEVHHIGSTAIKDMPAKPIIDILLECPNLKKITEIQQKLQSIGYAYLRRSIVPHYSFFTSNIVSGQRFQLHVFECGDPQIQRHILFRDYLIQHPEEAKSYATLKLKLSKKFRNDLLNYVKGKDSFVKAIDIKAKIWQDRHQHKEFNLCRPHHFTTPASMMKAMEANFNLHMTYYPQYINEIEFIRIPGYTLINSSLKDDTFNYVIDADFVTQEVEQKIKEISQYFHQKKLPFTWWIAPNDQPADLANHLEQQGFQNSENNIAMFLDLDQWQKPRQFENHNESNEKLQIVRALDEKTLLDFASILTNDDSNFKTYFSWVSKVLSQQDPIEFYVGYINHQPVVRGLICYYAGIAGLYWLSTKENARQRGYGTAMQYYRLQRAKQLGYHIAVLQASKQGLPLYKKLGYQECGVFKEYKQIF